MNYKVKYEITNCDGELDHPQAVSQSFTEEFHCDNCDSAAEAERIGIAKMNARYPGCSVKCILCTEYPLGGQGNNFRQFDPKDIKSDEQKARITKGS